MVTGIQSDCKGRLDSTGSPSMFVQVTKPGLWVVELVMGVCVVLWLVVVGVFVVVVVVVAAVVVVVAAVVVSAGFLVVTIFSVSVVGFCAVVVVMVGVVVVLGFGVAFVVLLMEGLVTFIILAVGFGLGLGANVVLFAAKVVLAIVLLCVIRVVF